MNGIRWRELSGAETTWLMYQQTLDGLESSAAKRKFLMQSEDVQGLRLLDSGAFKNETNLGTGGVNG